MATKYPPTALPLSGYTATASNIAFGWGPGDAFDGVIGNQGWHGPQNYQSYTNPPYKHVGSAVLGGVDGEWIKLELPSVMILSYIKIAPRNDPGDLNSGQAPKDLTILGSNDNSSWTVITSATNLTPASFGQFDQITAVATTGYTYYAVVVTRTSAGGGWVAIGELEFWGTAGSVATVNLQQVTASNPQTNITVELVNQTTSLTASGNVLVTRNVTASKFIGSGLELTGVALKTDLDDNVTRISDLETATIISNSSTITTGFQTGDILYASADNVLNKLGIGSIGEVLKSDGTVPVWGTDIGGSSGTAVWIATGVNGRIHYSSGNVGIGVSNPQHLLELPSTGANAGTVKAGFFIGDGSGLTNLTSASQWTGTNTVHFSGNVGIGTTDVSKTLSIGSNVSISDTGADKLSVAGNVYVSRNLTVADDIDVNRVHARNVFIKNVEVVSERPVKQR